MNYQQLIAEMIERFQSIITSDSIIDIASLSHYLNIRESYYEIEQMKEKHDMMMEKHDIMTEKHDRMMFIVNAQLTLIKDFAEYDKVVEDFIEQHCS
jgi:hypothetical protein